MADSLKKGINKCQIPLNKVTHMRQHNIEFQGFNGMGVVEGLVISKHNVVGSSNWQRYQPEVTADLLNRLSGHENYLKKEQWNVTRTKIGTPLPMNRLVVALFPKYLIWNDQACNTRVGDSTNCASNFLDKTLPLLCTVLVQDGIFLFQSSQIIG